MQGLRHASALGYISHPMTPCSLSVLATPWPHFQKVLIVFLLAYFFFFLALGTQVRIVVLTWMALPGTFPEPSYMIRIFSAAIFLVVLEFELETSYLLAGLE
jgi:hypothetical protein